MNYQDKVVELAKEALENAEMGAQLEIKDEVLKQSLLANFEIALLKAYTLGFNNAKPFITI